MSHDAKVRLGAEIVKIRSREAGPEDAPSMKARGQMSRSWGDHLALVLVATLLLYVWPAYGATGTHQRVLNRRVLLTCPRDTARVPLLDALRQLSKESGLLLAVRDHPRVHKAFLQAEELPLRTSLWKSAVVADAVLTSDDGWAALSTRVDGVGTNLWDYWRLRWGSFQRPISRCRTALLVARGLSPEQRWRMWRQGGAVRLGELEAGAYGRIREALCGSDREQAASMAEGLTPDTMISGRWVLRAELTSNAGACSAMLQEPRGGQRPAGRDVDAALDDLVGTCDRLLAMGTLGGPAKTSRARIALPAADAADRGLYTVAQLTSAIRAQAGEESFADARLKDEKIWLFGDLDHLDARVLKGALAAAMRSTWRSVGSVDLLVANPRREAVLLLNGAIWGQEARLQKQRFDTLFVKLARLWMPGTLHEWSDARLLLGTAPYEGSLTHGTPLHLVAPHMRKEWGNVKPADLIAGAGAGDHVSARVDPALWISISRPGGTPVEFGASAFR